MRRYWRIFLGQTTNLSTTGLVLQHGKHDDMHRTFMTLDFLVQNQRI